jgi:DNA-binding MarR family transcriptional regulator
MPANEDLMEQLHAVMFAFRSEMRRAVQESGHTLNGMEVRALLWIAAHASATARELAQHTGRDKAQLTRVIQQLEQADLLSRSADADDRRVQRLALTPQGAALVASLQAERQAVAARMLGKLSKVEQAQLAALLARLA